MIDTSFAPGVISRALAERWADELDEGESFEVSIDVTDAEARVVLSLVGTDASIRHEFQVRTPVGSRGSEGARDLALDAADAVLGEWLEDGRPRLAGLEVERDYQGSPVWVHARRVAPRLEAEADRLLGDGDEGGLDG